MGPVVLPTALASPRMAGGMLAAAVGRFLGFMAISGAGRILLMPAGPPPVAGATFGAFTILDRTPRGCTEDAWLWKRWQHAGQRLAYRSILFRSAVGVSRSR